MQIKSVGVIGAGQMGKWHRPCVLPCGYDVSLNDISRERIEAGLATINGNLARQVKSGIDRRGRSRFQRSSASRRRPAMRISALPI